MHKQRKPRLNLLSILQPRSKRIKILPISNNSVREESVDFFHRGREDVGATDCGGEGNSDCCVGRYLKAKITEDVEAL